MEAKGVLWAWVLILIYSSVIQAMTLSPPTKESAKFNKNLTNNYPTEGDHNMNSASPSSSSSIPPQPLLEMSIKNSVHVKQISPTHSGMSPWYLSMPPREDAFDFSGDDGDIDSEDDIDAEKTEQDIFESEQFILGNASVPLVISPEMNASSDYSLLRPFQGTPDYQTTQTHQNPINSPDDKIVDANTFLQRPTAASPNNPPVFEVTTGHTILTRTETVQTPAGPVVALENIGPTSTSNHLVTEKQQLVTSSYAPLGKEEAVVQLEGKPDQVSSPSVTGSPLAKREHMMVKKEQGENHTTTPAPMQSASPLVTKSGYSPMTRESLLIIGQSSVGVPERDDQTGAFNVTDSMETSSQYNYQHTANITEHVLNLPTSSATEQLDPGAKWQIIDQANPSVKTLGAVDGAATSQWHRTPMYDASKSLPAHRITHSYSTSEHGYDIYTNPADNTTTVIEVLQDAGFLGVRITDLVGGSTAKDMLPTEMVTISPAARLQHLTMNGGRRGVASTEPTKAESSTYFLALTAWRRVPSLDVNSFRASTGTMRTDHTPSGSYMGMLRTKPTVPAQRLTARVSNKTNIPMTQQPLTQEGVGTKWTTTKLGLPKAMSKSPSPSSHPTKMFETGTSQHQATEGGTVAVRTAPRVTGTPGIHHNVMTTTMGSQSEKMSLPCTPLTGGGRIGVMRRSFTTTPLSLPKVSQAAIPLSVNQCGPRINPLHPPGVKRRTVSLETFAAHHHNQQRALVMRQKEYNRYHQSWQRPFYGSIAEKEEYRCEIRQLLKWQMSQQWESQRYALFNRVKEGEAAREAERQATLRDREKQSARSRFLQAFRDENKKLMEIQWKEKRLAKSLDSLREREMLQYNPINWSCTLK